MTRSERQQGPAQTADALLAAIQARLAGQGGRWAQDEAAKDAAPPKHVDPQHIRGAPGPAR